MACPVLIGRGYTFTDVQSQTLTPGDPVPSFFFMAMAQEGFVLDASQFFINSTSSVVQDVFFTQDNNDVLIEVQLNLLVWPDEDVDIDVDVESLLPPDAIQRTKTLVLYPSPGVRVYSIDSMGLEVDIPSSGQTFTITGVCGESQPLEKLYLDVGATNILAMTEAALAHFPTLVTFLGGGRYCLETVITIDENDDSTRDDMFVFGDVLPVDDVDPEGDDTVMEDIEDDVIDQDGTDRPICVLGEPGEMICYTVLCDGVIYSDTTELATVDDDGCSIVETITTTYDNICVTIDTTGELVIPFRVPPFSGTECKRWTYRIFVGGETTPRITEFDQCPGGNPIFDWVLDSTEPGITTPPAQEIAAIGAGVVFDPGESIISIPAATGGRWVLLPETLALPIDQGYRRLTDRSCITSDGEDVDNIFECLYIDVRLQTATITDDLLEVRLSWPAGGNQPPMRTRLTFDADCVAHDPPAGATVNLTVVVDDSAVPNVTLSPRSYTFVGLSSTRVLTTQVMGATPADGIFRFTEAFDIGYQGDMGILLSSAPQIIIEDLGFRVSSALQYGTSDTTVTLTYRNSTVLLTPVESPITINYIEVDPSRVITLSRTRESITTLFVGDTWSSSVSVSSSNDNLMPLVVTTTAGANYSITTDPVTGDFIITVTGIITTLTSYDVTITAELPDTPIEYETPDDAEEEDDDTDDDPTDPVDDGVDPDDGFTDGTGDDDTGDDATGDEADDPDDGDGAEEDIIIISDVPASDRRYIITIENNLTNPSAINLPTMLQQFDGVPRSVVDTLDFSLTITASDGFTLEGVAASVDIGQVTFNNGVLSFAFPGGVTDSDLPGQSIIQITGTATEIVIPVMGCTDPLADNYNALATQDDGSCTFTVIEPEPERFGILDIELVDNVTGLRISGSRFRQTDNLLIGSTGTLVFDIESDFFFGLHTFLGVTQDPPGSGILARTESRTFNDIGIFTVPYTIEQEGFVQRVITLSGNVYPIPPQTGSTVIEVAVQDGAGVDLLAGTALANQGYRVFSPASYSAGVTVAQWREVTDDIAATYVTVAGPSAFAPGASLQFPFNGVGSNAGPHPVVIVASDSVAPLSRETAIGASVMRISVPNDTTFTSVGDPIASVRSQFYNNVQDIPAFATNAIFTEPRSGYLVEWTSNAQAVFADDDRWQAVLSLAPNTAAATPEVERDFPVIVTPGDSIWSFNNADSFTVTKTGGAEFTIVIDGVTVTGTQTFSTIPDSNNIRVTYTSSYSGQLADIQMDDVLTITPFLGADAGVPVAQSLISPGIGCSLSISPSVLVWQGNEQNTTKTVRVSHNGMLGALFMIPDAGFTITGTGATHSQIAEEVVSITSPATLQPGEHTLTFSVGECSVDMPITINVETQADMVDFSEPTPDQVADGVLYDVPIRADGTPDLAMFITATLVANTTGQPISISVDADDDGISDLPSASPFTFARPSTDPGSINGFSPNPTTEISLGITPGTQTRLYGRSQTPATSFLPVVSDPILRIGYQTVNFENGRPVVGYTEFGRARFVQQGLTPYLRANLVDVEAENGVGTTLRFDVETNHTFSVQDTNGGFQWEADKTSGGTTLMDTVTRVTLTTKIQNRAVLNDAGNIVPFSDNQWLGAEPFTITLNGIDPLVTLPAPVVLQVDQAPVVDVLEPPTEDVVFNVDGGQLSFEIDSGDFTPVTLQSIDDSAWTVNGGNVIVMIVGNTIICELNFVRDGSAGAGVLTGSITLQSAATTLVGDLSLYNRTITLFFTQEQFNFLEPLSADGRPISIGIGLYHGQPQQVAYYFSFPSQATLTITNVVGAATVMAQQSLNRVIVDLPVYTGDGQRVITFTVNSVRGLSTISIDVELRQDNQGAEPEVEEALPSFAKIEPRGATQASGLSYDVYFDGGKVSTLYGNWQDVPTTLITVVSNVEWTMDEIAWQRTAESDDPDITRDQVRQLDVMRSPNDLFGENNQNVALTMNYHASSANIPILPVAEGTLLQDGTTYFKAGLSTTGFRMFEGHGQVGTGEQGEVLSTCGMIPGGPFFALYEGSDLKARAATDRGYFETQGSSEPRGYPIRDAFSASGIALNPELAGVDFEGDWVVPRALARASFRLPDVDSSIGYQRTYTLVMRALRYGAQPIGNFTASSIRVMAPATGFSGNNIRFSEIDANTLQMDVNFDPAAAQDTWGWFRRDPNQNQTYQNVITNSSYGIALPVQINVPPSTDITMFGRANGGVNTISPFGHTANQLSRIRQYGQFTASTGSTVAATVYFQSNDGGATGAWTPLTVTLVNVIDPVSGDVPSGSDLGFVSLASGFVRYTSKPSTGNVGTGGISQVTGLTVARAAFEFSLSAVTIFVEPKLVSTADTRSFGLRVQTSRPNPTGGPDIIFDEIFTFLQ